MEFTTKVNIIKSSWTIHPCERMLFVGSCFADNIGKRFHDEKFNTDINPYGVMYNPASILHTVEKFCEESTYKPDKAFLTLGTNHVYILNETGEIVDNCMKRPQKLFTEKQLSTEECYTYLRKVVMRLMSKNRDIKIIITVSPIRYRKYGYHESQLSKATLLLAADRLCKEEHIDYFPAYEIMNDELRDYRFYKEDMLHPSDQAIEYIWERFAETYFGNDTNEFLNEWKPIKEALNHKPFNPEGNEYKRFIAGTMEKYDSLVKKWGIIK